MKSKHFITGMLAAGLLTGYPIHLLAAEDSIQLETTRIKANQELPQILYVVPWKDVSAATGTEQKLVLHDFFGDLYDPVIPSQTTHQKSIAADQPRKAMED